MIIRSKAPLRLGLASGGSGVAPHSDILIRAFSFLRFPLAVFVIMQHTKITKVIEFNFFDNLFYGLLLAIAKVAVPIFFIISGFFFFLNVKEFDSTTYKNKIIKRIKSLFIPYVLWNLICYLVLLVKDLITGRPTIQGGLLHIEIFFSSFFFFNSGTTPISAPMWFLRDLIIVILITPIIYMGLKRGRLFFLSLLFLLFFTYEISPLYDIYPAQPYTAPLFFSIGALLSINKNKDSISHFVIRKWILFLLFFCFCFLFYLNLYLEIKILQMIMVNCFGVCFVIFSALFLQMNNNIFKKIIMFNPACFFMFGLHILLVNSCLSVIYKIFPHVSMVLLFIAAVTMNVLLCNISYYIVRKVSPFVASILSGGRQ